MEQYEFVSRTESAPVRADLEKILQKMRNYVRKEDPELDFEYRLIGSGRKHLITRVVGGNRGFDFDFNLVIDHPGENQYWKGKYVHDLFLNAIRNAVKGTGFSDPEESTSAFTIKRVNKKKSSVNCSCDFAVVYYDGPKHLYYLHYNKDNGGFGFNERSFRYDVDEAIDEIIADSPNNWDLVRNEYLRLKNNNPQGKRSFVLYVEAVHIVYDQLFGKTPAKTVAEQYMQNLCGGFIIR